MSAVSRLFAPTRQAILQDPKAAALYLEESLEAGDAEAFKLALRHVAEARLGGIGELAKAADLNRETLYRTLSERGNYVLFLLCGKVPFLWFSKSVQNSANSIVANKGLIGQVEIRKTLFPYVAVVEALYKQWAVFALLFSIVWLMGFAPGLNWFWLLPLIAVQLALTILCSLVAALLVCFVPDTRFFVALGITFLLFVSGIFFDVADVADERARNLLLTLNPLAFLIAAYRTVLLDGGVYDVRHLALIGLASLFGVALVHYVYARLDRVIASRVLNQ
jgi:lipopolysaccharide transport system permease protein